MSDVIDLSTSSIPEPVRTRIENLRDLTADRHAAVLRANAARLEVQNKRMNVRARLEEFRGQGISDATPPLPSMIDEIKRLNEDVTRAASRAEALNQAWQPAARLLTNLERYVALVGKGGKWQLCDDDPPELRPGETPAAALERAAQHTQSLQAERLDIAAAPHPASVAKKRMRAEIAARIEEAKPDVTGLVDQLEPVRFPVSRRAIEQYDSAADLYVVDAVGLVAWALGEKFFAALDKEIDAVADDANALTVEQRREKLAVIDADILASEREEVHFAELCGALPRADLDPRALLRLADTMPAPRRDD